MNPPDRRSIPPATTMAARWTSRRSFSPEELPDAGALAEMKRMHPTTISVGIVASDASAVVGAVDRIGSELADEVALIDELIVFTSHPTTTAPSPASGTGGGVVDAADLVPEVTATDGRGDVLWRSLTAMRGDVVVWVDGDADLQPQTVTRLLGPLMSDPTIAFVKGFHGSADEFDIEIDNVTYFAGGARIAELVARPLLNLVFPELGGFFQPLKGPSAGRTALLRQIPFMSGCSVDVAMLIDVYGLVGLDGLAQVDLGTTPHGSRSLEELGPEAHAIARTILTRAEASRRIKLAPTTTAHPLLVRAGKSVNPARIAEIERPPIEVLPSYLAAVRLTGPNGNGRYAGANRS